MSPMRDSRLKLKCSIRRSVPVELGIRSRKLKEVSTHDFIHFIAIDNSHGSSFLVSVACNYDVHLHIMLHDALHTADLFLDREGSATRSKYMAPGDRLLRAVGDHPVTRDPVLQPPHSSASPNLSSCSDRQRSVVWRRVSVGHRLGCCHR